MKSYDEILQTMKQRYTEYTTNVPDDASDVGVRFAVLAGELFAMQAQIMWLKNQMFPSTASGSYLNLHASQRGIERKLGTKAAGTLKFYTDEQAQADIIIPKNTVCAANGDDPMRFYTDSEVVLHSGSTNVTVTATASKEGVAGNVSAQSIVNMVTPITGISGVTNPARMSGGSDEESDEQLRERILSSFVNVQNGTNKEFYKKAAMQINGVSAVGVVPAVRGPGTVDVYITNEEKSPSEELIAQVKAKLLQMREINVDIDVKALKPVYINVYVNVTVVSGYDISSVENECTRAIKKYFSLLNAGETMYLSEMGEYIKHIDGVKNYTFDHSLMTNQSVNEDSFISYRYIVVRGAAE